MSFGGYYIVSYNIVDLRDVVIGLQHGQEDGLAETPRTDDELIGRVAVFQNRNQFRLVGVGKVVFTDGRKVRLSDGNAVLFGGRCGSSGHGRVNRTESEGTPQAYHKKSAGDDGHPGRFC